MHGSGFRVRVYNIRIEFRVRVKRIGFRLGGCRRPCGWILTISRNVLCSILGASGRVLRACLCVFAFRTEVRHLSKSQDPILTATAMNGRMLLSYLTAMPVALVCGASGFVIIPWRCGERAVADFFTQSCFL